MLLDDGLWAPPARGRQAAAGEDVPGQACSACDLIVASEVIRYQILVALLALVVGGLGRIRPGWRFKSQADRGG